MATAKEVIDDLVDILACTDGGLELVTFMESVRTLYKQADEGDCDSIKVVQHLERFHHLVKHLAGRKS